jgi:hypothetical protein
MTVESKENSNIILTTYRYMYPFAHHPLTGSAIGQNFDRNIWNIGQTRVVGLNADEIADSSVCHQKVLWKISTFYLWSLLLIN